MAGVLGVANRLYQGLIDPLLVRMLRAGRLQALGVDDLPLESVDWRADALCRSPCPLDKASIPRLLRRYAMPGRATLTPMVIRPDRLPDAAAVDAMLKSGSSRTLSKIRKAERAGYAAHPFPLERHVEDVHAIRTSAAFRAAGPVLDRWLLRPEHVGKQAIAPVSLAEPGCPAHWIAWWGVFLPDADHWQGGVAVGERLVGYIKLMRIGDVVHYTEIMGHADHLDANVVWLLHRAVLRWLVEQSERPRVLLYGALEHGGAGLLTWKKRAGFAPVRLVARS